MELWGGDGNDGVVGSDGISNGNMPFLLFKWLRMVVHETELGLVFIRLEF